MEWMSFSAAVFLILSFLTATSSGDFPTGAFQAVRCMLMQTAPSKCSGVTEVHIPNYLIKAYSNSPTSLHEALRSGQLAQLSNEQIASLPLTLLYLIPKERLSDLSGTQLAAILQRHADDTSIAHQLVASTQHQKQLVELLKLSTLTQDVLQVFGESLSKSELNRSLSSLLPNEPLLAYLRPDVMLDLNDHTAYNVLLRLKEIQPVKFPKRETIYPLAQMAIKNHYSFGKIKWLVSGLSPDELKNDSLRVDLNYHHFKLDLSVAQTRAVFEQIYKNKNLTKSDLIDFLPVLTKLTPSMLQRLPAREYNYDYLLELSLPPSLATACQIQEYIKANCNLTGKLPKVANEEWGFRIHYLGRWVFTLPLTALEEYLSAPLDTARLLEIESPALSPLQTYYLTGRGRAFDLSAHSSVNVPEFLHALPASQLLNQPSGSITTTVLEHLASNLPADNLPRTLAFLHRIASVLSEPSILENLLDNSNVNTIMSLISPKEFKAAAPKMLNWFKNKPKFASTIRQLPQQILAALLEQEQGREDWTWENMLDKLHVSHLLVGGLTCQHIEQIATGLFIPIIAEYNRHRKQEFPRNLQICSLQKLIRYLKFKMRITQADPDHGLISLLEPVEIESIGGYVLVGLPVEALKESPYLAQILVKIGKLSNAELILAANMTKLYAIAQLALDEFGNDVYVSGNLVWFLPPYTTISHLKLMLQSGLIDTTLCLPQHLRKSVAMNLKTEFGPPELWSAGVLATLQDLLMVFTENELANVSRAAWTDAADTLTSHYGDNVNWIKPMPFHQVCASFLEESEEEDYKSSVRRLVRWQLQAAQWLLDTVKRPTYASVDERTTDIRGIHLSDEDEPEITPNGALSPPMTEDLSSTSEISTSTTETTSVSSTTETISVSSTTENTSVSSTTETTSVSSTTKTKILETSSSTISSTQEASDTPTETTTQVIKSTTNYEISEEKISDSPSDWTNSFPYSDNIAEEEGSKENSSNKYYSSSNDNTEKSSFNTVPSATNSERNIESNPTTLQSTSHLPTSTNIIKVPTATGVKENTQSNPTTTQTTSHLPTTTNIIEVPTANSVKGNTISSPTSLDPTTHFHNTANIVQVPSATSVKENTTSNPTSIESTTHLPTRTNTPLTDSLTTTLDESANSLKTHSPDGNAYNMKPTVSSSSEINEKLPDLNIDNNSHTTNITNYQSEHKGNHLQSEELTNKAVTDVKDMSTISTNFMDNPNSIEEDETENENYSIIENTAFSGSRNVRRRRAIFQSETAIQLSCNALRMVGRLSGIALTEKDVKGMSKSEIEECRVELGAMDLSLQIRNNLWKLIGKDKKMEGTHLLGRLLQVAVVGDIWDLETWDIRQPWVLETIHALTINSNDPTVVNRVIDEVDKANTEKTPELLAALEGALCLLEWDTSNLQFPVIGLQSPANCRPCLPLLASKAVQLLGPVSEWTQHYVHSLNDIVAGLELKNWKELTESSLKPLSALQPSAIMCLNNSHLEILTSDHINVIPTLTLHALLPQQIAALNETQVHALRVATQVSVEDKMTPSKKIGAAGSPSSGSYLLASSLLVLASFLCTFS